MKRRISWIACFLCLFLFVMQGCVHIAAESPSPTVNQNKEAKRDSPPASSQPSLPIETDSLPEGEAVANVQINNDVDILLYINNPDWAYSYDATSGQIYIFDPADASYSNMISISSYDIKTTADALMIDIWSQIEQSLTELTPQITAEKDIAVGKNEYTGVRYNLTITYDDVQSEIAYLLWATEKKVYLCSVTALDKDASLVENILQGILDGFACLHK